MSSKRLDQISDYARHGLDLLITCIGCGYRRQVDSRALTDLCCRRRWSRVTGAVVARLYCSQCEGRDLTIGMIERTGI